MNSVSSELVSSKSSRSLQAMRMSMQAAYGLRGLVRVSFATSFITACLSLFRAWYRTPETTKWFGLVMLERCVL